MAATYDFTVDKATGHPVQLLMTGVNLFTGSHYDHWVIDYYNYSTESIPDSEFDVPDICKTAEPLPAKYQVPGSNPPPLSHSGPCNDRISPLS